MFDRVHSPAPTHRCALNQNSRGSQSEVRQGQVLSACYGLGHLPLAALRQHDWESTRTVRVPTTQKNATLMAVHRLCNIFATLPFVLAEASPRRISSKEVLLAQSHIARSLRDWVECNLHCRWISACVLYGAQLCLPIQEISRGVLRLRECPRSSKTTSPKSGRPRLLAVRLVELEVPLEYFIATCATTHTEIKCLAR